MTDEVTEHPAPSRRLNVSGEDDEEHWLTSTRTPVSTSNRSRESTPGKSLR